LYRNFNIEKPNPFLLLLGYVYSFVYFETLVWCET